MKKKISDSEKDYPAKLHIDRAMIESILQDLANLCYQRSRVHMKKPDPQVIEDIIIQTYDPIMVSAEIMRNTVSLSGGIVHYPGRELTLGYEKAIGELDKFLNVKRLEPFHRRIKRHIKILRHWADSFNSNPVTVSPSDLGFQHKTITSMIGGQVKGIYEYLRPFAAKDSISDKVLFDFIAKIINGVYGRSDADSLIGRQAKKVYENTSNKAR